LRLFGFFLDVHGALLGVKRHHAVALRVHHMVSKHGGASGALVGAVYQEGVRQIAEGGVELDAVKAGLLGEASAADAFGVPLHVGGIFIILAASLLGALDDPTARALSGSHSLDLEWAPRPDAGPQMTPRYSAPGRRWTVPSIMAAVNEKVVNRSAALKPELYGQRGGFAYHEATLVPNAVGAAIGGALMATAGLLLALPPTRWLLMKARLARRSARAAHSSCHNRAPSELRA
jgi:hypothetical protein